MNRNNYGTRKIEQPPVPPFGGSGIVEVCNHKWIHQISDYSKKEQGHNNYCYKRIDTYYCEKCLEIKEFVTKEENYCTNKPYWFKG